MNEEVVENSIKHEFIEFPKMARLSREVIVTEKLDGTNAQIFIQHESLESKDSGNPLVQGFVPDAIMVDYLNICASARIKPGNGVNSYTYIKAIAEELRGLAVEFNVPVWSATQLTRSGYGSSDPDMTDTSESFGLPATADLFFALVVNEQMEQLKQVMVKQLKNRYNDPSLNKRFVIGIDKSKMKLYDVEQSAQNIVDSGQEDDPIPRITKFDKPSSNKFKGLKV